MTCVHCKGETFDKKRHCEECIQELKKLRDEILFGFGYIAIGIIASVLATYFIRYFSIMFTGLCIYGSRRIGKAIFDYRKTGNIRFSDPRTGQVVNRNLQILRGLPVEPDTIDKSNANRQVQQPINDAWRYGQNFPYKHTSNGMGYPEEKRNQSIAGVITFIISIINAALVISSYVVIVLAQKFTETWGGLIIFYCFFLVIGLIAGITGLVQREYDKKYAKIGMIIQASTFVFFIISFIALAWVLPGTSFAPV